MFPSCDIAHGKLPTVMPGLNGTLLSTGDLHDYCTFAVTEMNRIACWSMLVELDGIVWNCQMLEECLWMLVGITMNIYCLA